MFKSSSSPSGVADSASEEVVVEAPTVEAALEAVTTQMGTGCLIVGAEKVRSGGVGGFFGKETYRVTVQRRPEPGAQPASATVAEAVDRALEIAGSGVMNEPTDLGFGDVLRAEMAVRGGFPSAAAEPAFDGIDLVALESESDEAPESGEGLERLRAAVQLGRESQDQQPEQPAEAPVQEPDMPVGPPKRVAEPMFSPDNLVRAGLPFGFVSQLGDLASLDETSQLARLAGALGPWCDGLPGDDVIVVGSEVVELADLTGLEVYQLSELVPFEGSLALACRPGDSSTDAYLDRVRAGRRLHIIGHDVASLAGTEHGSIVSWTNPEAGCAALQLALERGLHLGYDLSGTEPRRATALEVAISVRSRLPLAKA